ncbi:MAG: glycosyltransferase family 4 protein [Bacteroidota bacterium]
MINIYIDVPCFSMGGVEFFSIYTGLSLYKKGYKIFLVESVAHRNIPVEALADMQQHIPILTTEEFLILVKNENHAHNVVIMSWNSKLYEVMYNYVTKVKDNIQVIGYSHNAAVYYYDTLKLYEPIISKFICVSKTIQDDLVKVIPDRKKDILYHPCPTSISHQKNWDNHSNEISVLFVGRIEDASKGVFRLISIYEELVKRKVKFKLKILGKGIDLDSLKDRFRSKFGDTTDQYEFIENAHTPKEVLNYMKVADILIVTSNFEGGPIVVYEAMSCMVVPITFNVGNIASIIDNGSNGFITNIGNVNAIVESIVYLFQNPDKKRKMAEEAYKSVTKLGYLQEMYDNFLIRLCAELIKNPFVKNAKQMNNNLNLKKMYLNIWMRKIIPNHIDKQYRISEYFRECELFEKEKSENYFNKLLLDKEHEIKALKEENEKIRKQLEVRY